MTKTDNPMKSVGMTQKLTESSIMLALATLLSIIKLAELPYGGSITLASMLPLIIISYRYGLGWGSLVGSVYGLIQMLFGLKNLSYATSIVAAIAIILLDYIFAFAATCFGASFRSAKNVSFGFGLAAFTVCAVRYLFHVISGCTVWAGLSIPTTDALLYSLIYNATYMIPETIVTIAAAVYLSSLIDFSAPHLKTAKTEKSSAGARILNLLSGLAASGAIIAIVVMVFPLLQNAESGAFDITGIRNVNVTVVGIIAAAAVTVVCVLQIIRLVTTRKDEE